MGLLDHFIILLAERRWYNDVDDSNLVKVPDCAESERVSRLPRYRG
jgi:hypothetical protein